MPSQITEVQKPCQEEYPVRTGPDSLKNKKIAYDGKYDGKVVVTTYDCFNNSHSYEATIPHGTNLLLISEDNWAELALERLEAWADSSDYTIRYQ